MFFSALQEGSLNKLLVGMQCISTGHHEIFASPITAKCNEDFASYLDYCMSLGVDQIFKYWKERNKKLNLLADKSPTHYEYLKEKIYS